MYIIQLYIIQCRSRVGTDGGLMMIMIGRLAIWPFPENAGWKRGVDASQA